MQFWSEKLLFFLKQLKLQRLYKKKTHRLNKQEIPTCKDKDYQAIIHDLNLKKKRKETC